MSQWDGPRFTPPPERGSSWALPVLLVLVGVLGIIGVGYGVKRVTAPKPPSSEGLPTGDQGTGQPAGEAAHTLPSASMLLGKCRAAGEPKDRAAASRAIFRVAYRDDSGYAVWIGSASFDRVCSYQWSGESAELLGVSTGGGGSAPGGATVAVGGTSAITVNGRTGLRAQGSVAANVRRVRVSWAGGFQPSEAAVEHGWFLAQGVQERAGASKATGDGCQVEAYDETDKLVAHVPCGSGF